jgi:hypothetical protein
MTSIDDVIRLLEAAKAADSGTSKQRTERKQPAKKKRAASAYSKRYGRAFKKLAPKYKKKNGQWKKDGFKRCAAAARRMAKK